MSDTPESNADWVELRRQQFISHTGKFMVGKLRGRAALRQSVASVTVTGSIPAPTSGTIYITGIKE